MTHYFSKGVKKEIKKKKDLNRFHLIKNDQK